MGVHIIVGEDDYLVERAARERIGGVSDVETIDSINSTNEELQLADLRAVEESIATPPFLEPRKVTWWRHAEFLPGAKVSAAVKERLDGFAEKLAAREIPENQELVVTASHLLQTSIFAKRLATVAQVAVFATGKPYEEQRKKVVWAIDEAKELGLLFAPGAAERFVAAVGSDTRSLRNELEKMRAYLGDERAEITPSDIAEIASCGRADEPEMWDVTDAIGNRNAAAALAALAKFKGENSFAVVLSGVIEKFLRQLIDVALKRADGLNPYVLRKTEGFLRNWTLPELKAARMRFFRLRERSVSGPTTCDLQIEIELLRILRRRGR